MNTFEFLRTDRLITIAHRGGIGEAPENTLKAFLYTANMGFDCAELDVWADPNGELFVWHGSLFDFFRGNTTQELDHGPESNAPYLSTVLDELPSIRYIIDPKHTAAIEPLAKIITERKLVDQVCVSSSYFNRSLQVAQLVKEKCGKELCIGMPGLMVIRSQIPRAYIAPNTSLKTPAAVAFAPHQIVGPRLIKAAHASGLKVVADVFNEPRTMRRLLDLEVDGIMTDFPSRLNQILRSRE